MKTESIRIRVEPALKRSFEAAAKFNHQSLSQFLIQASIRGVERSREGGARMKPPPAPKDERGKHRRKSK